MTVSYKMAASLKVVFRVCCHNISRQHSFRKFCHSAHGSTNIPITDIPLSKPVPFLTIPKYATVDTKHHETEVTVLENGLRVTTQDKFGQFCTVGVVIDSGSRYEVAYPSGISHFLEKLAFSSTSLFEDRDSILQELEKHGGICDCQGSRDTLIYAISAETKGLSSVINILSEVVLRPQISDSELADTRAACEFELESLAMQPDPEPLLMEMIHKAAFRGNTLGLPKLVPTENIPLIDKKILYTYLKNVHVPERMVLAGIGMEHQLLVDFAQQYFVNKKPLWLEHPELVHSGKACDNSYAQYTGGVVQVEKDLSNVSLGPNPMPELAHLIIGLESCSHKDDDFIAVCVLNMLMGGGGSFSAGGPGKGMYTRLYLNVLNRYHWIYSATAVNNAYEDTGLFCIHASAHPSQLKDLTEVIVRELVYMAGAISEEELSRAKRQLQSMLMMNLESRPVVFEDVGRQVLANGHRKAPQYYFDKIAEITDDDVRRVATRLLRSTVSVAAYGTLNKLPSRDDIQAALTHKDGRFPRKISLFR